MYRIASVLLLACASLGLSSKYESKRHSLLPPYTSDDWSLAGNAVSTVGLVRLTSDTRSQTGAVRNVNPINFQDWEVHLTFSIHGEGTSLYGDGFAFWYTEHPLSPGSAFGSSSEFRGLGIFFDTYANQNGAHGHDHPYISAMINDGSDSYDHDKDGTLTELSGCSAQIRGKAYTTAIIRYYANRLEIKLKYANIEEPVSCFDVEDVVLPTGYYLGVSAATGDLTDNHDLHSIRTYMLISDRSETPVDTSNLVPSYGKGIKKRDRVPDSPPSSKGSRVFWTIFYWFVILTILVVVGLFCFKYYKRRQRQSKRLY